MLSKDVYSRAYAVNGLSLYESSRDVIHPRCMKIHNIPNTSLYFWCDDADDVDDVDDVDGCFCDVPEAEADRLCGIEETDGGGGGRPVTCVYKVNINIYKKSINDAEMVMQKQIE